MLEDIDIRFSARPEYLSKLARLSELHGFRPGKAASRHLSAIYYDTPDLALAKAGLTLQVRKSRGRYFQTVKSNTGGVFAPGYIEYETQIASSEPHLDTVPDEKLREKFQEIIADGVIVPVIESDTKRTIRSLTSPVDDEIELVIERGHIRDLRNGSPPIPAGEVELALNRGAPLALYDAARELSKIVPLAIRLEDKAEQALRTIEGRKARAYRPKRSLLPPDATAEVALRQTLEHCLNHIASNTAAIVQARDPEGVHQIRVGLRRLRTALSTFGVCMQKSPLTELSVRAKIIAKSLGETRELDVFADELMPPIEAACPNPGLAALRSILDVWRAESWDRAVAAIQAPEFTAFLLELGAVANVPLWPISINAEEWSKLSRPSRELACETLELRLKKAAKRARHLAALDTENRHRLRLALKRLRYSAEFFAPLFPARSVSMFLQRLIKLQDIFGAMNDSATASKILNGIVERASAKNSAADNKKKPQPELLQAAAFVEGWHQGRVAPAWDKAKRRWKRFAKTEPFWRK